MTSYESELAYQLAKFAHKGKMYGDYDYFEYHVLGVANNFDYGTSRNIVALLHDVLEDSDITYETLENIFGFKIAKSVLAVTNLWPPEMYLSEYIPNVLEDEVSTLVKIADLKFHLSQRNVRSERKYKQALKMLEDFKPEQIEQG